MLTPHAYSNLQAVLASNQCIDSTDYDTMNTYTPLQGIKSPSIVDSRSLQL